MGIKKPIATPVETPTVAESEPEQKGPAIDRVLERLGYDNAANLAAPTSRLVLFYRGELRQYLLRQLRERGPATSRTLAERLIQIGGKDSHDRRLMADVARRVGRAMAQMRDAEMVVGTQTKSMGEYLWQSK